MPVATSRTFQAAMMFVGLLAVAAVAAAQDAPTRPKYGPAVTRLRDAREFVRTAPAADFWALIPYYLPQLDDQSCSVATACMLVNAVRAERKLTADDELATPAGVLGAVEPRAWKDKVAAGGAGLTLDEFAAVVPQALRAYGEAECRVTVVRFPEPPDAALARLRKLLVANERSSRDFVVANFLQSVVTGDPAGAVGHLAPIAAYDAETHRVLVFDPDRRWYEPYWVPDETLLAAMRAPDADAGQPRGLLWVERAGK